MKMDTLVKVLFGEITSHNLKLWRGLERYGVMDQHARSCIINNNEFTMGETNSNNCGDTWIRIYW
jgi:hypothetical protein